MTPRIVVAGVTSLYTSVGVHGFPVRYRPTCTPRWSASGVSGSAWHIARTASALGAQVRLCTVVGTDPAGAVIRAELAEHGLLGPGTITSARSSTGLVLVDPDGRRMGYPYLAPVNDVTYPFRVLAEQAKGADLLVLTNARFVRPLVAPAAALGIPLAVDAHVVSGTADPYNRPWLQAAHVLFCSDEHLPVPPARWIAEIFDEYPRCAVAGLGMGEKGALVGLRNGQLITVEAVAPRGVVNTAGAGDALFATFLYYWTTTEDPVFSLRAAVLNAGWKIGDMTPAGVSLTCPELRSLPLPPVTVGRW